MRRNSLQVTWVGRQNATPTVADSCVVFVDAAVGRRRSLFAWVEMRHHVGEQIVQLHTATNTHPLHTAVPTVDYIIHVSPGVRGNSHAALSPRSSNFLWGVWRKWALWGLYSTENENTLSPEKLTVKTFKKWHLTCKNISKYGTSHARFLYNSSAKLCC